MFKRDKFCEECGTYGHRKWLWFGTHRTHRIYLRYKMKQRQRKLERELKKT
jgi:hypothetical protein